MNLSVKPATQLKGKVFLPASKSYSIRACIIAACGGMSTINSISDCDDAKVALKIARALGADIKPLKNNSYRIKAFHHPFKLSSVNVQESGTVLRFLLPLVSLYAAQSIIDGEGTLKGRPNLFLTQTLREMGVDIKGTGPKESVPIHFHGGNLHAGDIAIDGSLSSQFISALLIACPQLKGDSTLTLKGKKLVSSDYITMTIQILKKSGIVVQQRGQRYFAIKGLQKFKGLKNFTVPSDYGLAAFLLAAACLVNSDVTLTGFLSDDFIQADGQILNFLKKMGARFTKTSKFLRVQGPCSLKGGDFSLKSCPDLVPIMAVLALFADGRTRLYDIAHARAKESDRISDLRTELLKLGAKVSETANELIIEPQASYKENCVLDPHHDHRLAMAFSVFGLRHPVVVKDVECTHKSYPGFFKDFKALGAKVFKQ
ncbi:MAG: 3-phosphoshikimate 1-carboxyvinyltransferase [Candidatus Omnitrophica bacterium]|nr:3-phosphoshikimate 1-carboxyvinyltransferase [Candidatus Omnitrophota bacterium]